MITGPEEDDDGEEDEVVEDVNVCKSLFDATVLPDLQSAVAHDAMTYGFFLPDIEYVSDMDGLLEYLHEKVDCKTAFFGNDCSFEILSPCSKILKTTIIDYVSLVTHFLPALPYTLKVAIGHMCLCCNKMFRSATSCRQHMIDSAHCKIKYDVQDDMDEVSDFYDFTNADDLAGASPATEEDDGEDDAAFAAELAGKKKFGLEVLPSGELLVTRPDGTRKQLGVRWLKLYYAQNAKVIDDRASVSRARFDTST